MEVELQDQLRSLISEDPVVCGAFCLDQQGLVICQEGKVSEALPYNVSLLAKHAATLAEEGAIPTVTVEFNSCKVSIKSADKIILAIVSETG